MGLVLSINWHHMLTTLREVFLAHSSFFLFSLNLNVTLTFFPTFSIRSTSNIYLGFYRSILNIVFFDQKL